MELLLKQIVSHKSLFGKKSIWKAFRKGGIFDIFHNRYREGYINSGKHVYDENTGRIYDRRYSGKMVFLCPVYKIEQWVMDKGEHIMWEYAWKCHEFSCTISYDEMNEKELENCIAFGELKLHRIPNEDDNSDDIW